MISREGMQKYLRARSCATSRTTRWCMELVSAQGQQAAGRRQQLQRRGQLPRRQARRKRRAGHGQDGADLPRPAGAMHAVPQPSVQRVEAEPVLGVQRLLPPDARPIATRRGTRTRSPVELTNRTSPARTRRVSLDGRDEAGSSTSCATALSAVAYPVFVDGTRDRAQRLA